MKRFLLFLLAVLTVLSCACSPDVSETEHDGVLTESETYSDETDTETEDTETEGIPDEPIKTVYTNEYAYIRAGDWRAKNWHDILEERGLESMLIMKNGNEETNVTRYVLLRFDLSGFTEEAIGRADLAVNFTGIQPDMDIPFSIFLVDNSWSEDAVTWDSRPSKLNDEPIAKNVLLKNQTADVTSAVKAMVARGEKSITLMILQTEATKNETRIRFSSLDEKAMPRLIIDRNGKSEAKPIELGTAKEETMRYFYTTEYAYVRNGSSGGNNWGDMNWHDILAARGLSDMIILKDGEANNHVSRLGLFRFNLGGFAAEDVGYAEFFVKFSRIGDGTPVHFDIYLVEDNWDEATVTWNTMPKKLSATPVISDAVFGSLQKVNATNLIQNCLRENKTSFTLLLVQTDKTQSETRMEFAKVGNTNMPHFKVYREDPAGGASYVKQLVADEQKNQEIWDRARQMFNEWYPRYTALKNRGDLDAERIIPDASEYTKTVMTPGSNPSGTMKPQNTRTYDALADFTPHEVKLDQFGGIMDNAMKQEATGFFYTKKIGDRWWIIDPLGYPCYVIGLNGITPIYQNSPKQKAAFEKNFGGDYESWAEATVNHVRNDLGFNAQTGSHSSAKLVEPKLSTFAGLSIMSRYATSKGINASIGGRTRLSENNTLPVFDPDFESFADSRVASVVDPDNPYLIGYTSDNELAIEDHMLKDYLTIDPGKEVNYYSYACAWYWITQMTGKQEITEADLTPELCDLFRGFVWDRYYYVVSTALEKHDPNHMFAGTRYLNEVKESEWILRVSGEYLDMITINWYGAWEPQAEYVYDFARYADAPFFVSEFYAKSSDTEDNLACTSGGGFFVKTQEDRGLFYQNYTLRLLEAKNCVGWHWFQYADNDPTGNPTDVSSIDANKGIVSNTHKEYTELTERMTEINKNSYMLIDYFDTKYDK